MILLRSVLVCEWSVDIFIKIGVFCFGMEIEVVGSTNRIKNPETAKRFVQNHARKCYTEKGWSELLIENFQTGLIKSLITRGHHSPFDHFQLNLDFVGTEKVLAMVFNNQGVYTTSEKSARYTKMSDIPDHQKGLYDKWDGWFNDEISSRFPEGDFHKLHKRGGDGKTTAEKLSQENARYMTSSFTPTTMTHSVSWRQLNILYHSFGDFIEENRGCGDKFRENLVDGMQSFVNSSDIQKWVIDEAQVRMKGAIPLRFIKGSPVEEHFGEDIYSTNYKASFASLAQLHRHRLLVYDICKDVKLGGEDGFYVPRLVEAAGKSDEWESDLRDVAEYDFPQAQLLRVGERGMREHFPAKSLERECGLAQLETSRIVDSVLGKYGKSVSSMKDFANPSCVIEGGCKRGGCIFGADKYLERLV